MKIQMETTPHASSKPQFMSFMNLVKSNFGNDESLEQTFTGGPDIIHFWGGWNKITAWHAHIAYSKNIPYIITPAEAYMPWEMTKTPLKRATGALHYEKKFVKQAQHILVCGKMEADYMKAMKWNSNISCIANPFVTYGITSEDAIDSLKKLYQETIALYDQHKRRMIVKKAKEICSNAEINDPTLETIEQLMEKILYLRYLYQRNNIPRQVLEELALFMKQQNYNEEIMAQMLEQQKLLKFTSELEAVLYNEGLLTEGFMPVIRRYDRTCEKITSSIRN